MIGLCNQIISRIINQKYTMFENVINYKPEYKPDAKGHKQRFEVDDDGNYLLEESKKRKDGSRKLDQNKSWYFNGEDTLEITADFQLLSALEQQLIPARNGQYYRNWRQQIQSPDDIWNEIVKVTKIPGVTSAPKLQPIETRLVMLQTGMRAPMGIKVYGSDLKTIQDFGLQLEEILKQVPSVKKEAVFADRIPIQIT